MDASGGECNVLDQLAEEFAARLRRGEHPPLTEYTTRHPEFAEQIRELFPALAMMERLKPTQGDDRSAEDLGPAGAVPERIGDYRILRLVGRGGMGIVYEAEQVSLGRHVALKVLSSSAVADPVQLERFRREAKAAAALHHSNIVPVFGVGEADGTHYFAMQFIQGESLDRVLRDVRRLRAQDDIAVATSPLGSRSNVAISRSLVSGEFANPGNARQEPNGGGREKGAKPVRASESSSASLTAHGPDRQYYRSVARVGLQVAEALAYAHRHGILHRDIKPSNLLLDLEGTVWVTDFGLAKAEDAGELTRTGDVVGTVRYMAPERFDGVSVPQSDVYGLGVTLYEMLTLRPAFADSHQGRLIERILREEPPRPRKLDARIPRDLETIVRKAAARRAHDRYAGAAEMAEDLHRFLADRTLLARRSKPWELSWRWCRRNPAVASLLLIITLLLVGGLAGMSFLYRNADSQRERAESAEEAWKDAATAAREGEARARQSEADAKAVLGFFEKHVLQAARPKGQGGGLGVNATVREAVDGAEPAVADAFAQRPLVEASVRQVLGITYWFGGEYRRAVEQHERVLVLRRDHLGPEHSDTLNAMAMLAQDYLAASRIGEAIRLQEDTLKLRRARLGPSDPETLWTMNRLAEALRVAGRLAEALPLYEEGLRRAKGALGPDHPDTLIYGDNLAGAYRAAGRLDEALPLYVETLRVERAKLGSRHPDTLATMNNLAVAYDDAGRFAEAIDLHRETLECRKAMLGSEHPDTLASMNGLALACADAGRHAEAVPLLEQAVKVSRATQGSEHRLTLMLTGNFGQVSERAGLCEQALPLLDEAIRGLGAQLGADHPSRLAFINEKAQCLLRLKKFEDALAVLGGCLDLRARRDAEDWWVFQTKSQIGQALTGLRKYGEAEACLRAAYDGLIQRERRIPVRQRCVIDEAAHDLVVVYEAQGKPERAAEWRREPRRPTSGKP